MIKDSPRAAAEQLCNFSLHPRYKQTRPRYPSSTPDTPVPGIQEIQVLGLFCPSKHCIAEIFSSLEPSKLTKRRISCVRDLSFGQPGRRLPGHCKSLFLRGFSSVLQTQQASSKTTYCDTISPYLDSVYIVKNGNCFGPILWYIVIFSESVR